MNNGGEPMKGLLADPTRMLETRRFRDVLGSFTTGLVIVTTVGEDGRPIGLTVNSFNSVSLDPPLILLEPSAQVAEPDRLPHPRLLRHQRAGRGSGSALPAIFDSGR